MKHQAGLCASVFLSVYVLMFLCCHDNTSLNGREPVAALANPLPFSCFSSQDKSPFRDAVNLAWLYGDCPVLYFI